jgi:hypothetical protein
MKNLIFIFFVLWSSVCLGQLNKREKKILINYGESLYIDRQEIIAKKLNLFNNFSNSKNASQALCIDIDEQFHRLNITNCLNEYNSSAQTKSTSFKLKEDTITSQKPVMEKVNSTFIKIEIGDLYYKERKKELLGNYKDTFELKRDLLELSDEKEKAELFSRHQRFRYHLEFLKNTTDSINRLLISKGKINKLMLSFNFDYQAYIQFLPSLLKSIDVDTLIITKGYQRYYPDDYVVNKDTQNIPILALQDAIYRAKFLFIFGVKTLYLPNELSPEKLIGIKAIFLDADSVYNLKKLDDFRGLENLELWRVRNVYELSDLKYMNTLKNLSINHTILRKKIKLGKNYSNLSSIVFYDNIYLGSISESSYCLPELENVEFKVLSIRKPNRKKIKREYRRLSRTKGKCYKQWKVIFKEYKNGDYWESYFYKLSIKKIK